MIVLAIESSCDETSASVIKSTRGKIEILSNIISSQISIHQKYGGVVPEVAARHHVQNINWVINDALTEAKIDSKKIDVIATTAGPGLITSLIVGIEAAKTLAFAWNKPLLPVNHMYGHIAANFLQPISFPAVCLVVSGGHTEIVVLKNHTQMKKIGQTVDDAIGEAFDKVAKLLNLGYPGGPIVSKLAENGDAKKFSLPRPMLASKDFNFSFSGLKTSVLYNAQKIKKQDDQFKADMCASFQQAAVEVVVKKTIRAAEKYKAKTIMMAGGVAANKKLRLDLESATKKFGANFTVPPFVLCTDNAAMIGIAGTYLANKKMPSKNNWHKTKVDPNWELL